MEKIKEALDLSKKVLDIDVNSEVFTAAIEDLNVEIQRVIKNVYEGKFQGGEVNLKLNLKIVNATEAYANTDEEGNVIQEIYKYKRPDFSHTVTSSPKKVNKQEGSYSPKREISYDEEEDKFIAKPLFNPQVEFKLEEGEKDD